MKTVKEVSKISGVSVRTLHYYDAIGLLKPAKVAQAGYRLYDDTALSRLQTILLFKELQFPLKEIKQILDNPDFNQAQALEQQIDLPELQYKHIGRLISFARELQKKGDVSMDFKAFDTSEIEQYKAEAKEKWGKTSAYREYEQKTEKGECSEGAQKLMAMFAEIGKLKAVPPCDKKVQEKIAYLKYVITENFYTCTNEILDSLSQMYVEDERFKKNIDSAGGDGTAEFVRQAVIIYCKNN